MTLLIDNAAIDAQSKSKLIIIIININNIILAV